MLRILTISFLLLMTSCAGTNTQTLSDDSSPPAEGTQETTESAPAANTDLPAAAGDSEEVASKSKCCGQCSEAASKDPAGRDISMNSCSSYAGYSVNGQTPLDDLCVKWFDANPLTVMDCR